MVVVNRDVVLATLGVLPGLTPTGSPRRGAWCGVEQRAQR
jgi:hypothetical protein